MSVLSIPQPPLPWSLIHQRSGQRPSPCGGPEHVVTLAINGDCCPVISASMTFADIAAADALVDSGRTVGTVVLPPGKMH